MLPGQVRGRPHENYPLVEFDHREKFGCRSHTIICANVGGHKNSENAESAAWDAGVDPIETRLVTTPSRKGAYT